MWIQLLLTLLPNIIQFVEQVHGPKTGTTKLGAATQLAQNALTVAAAAGKIPAKAAADIGAITKQVQLVVDDLKKKGTI